MRPLTEAQRAVLDAMRPLPTARIPLAEAAGLVLAEDVRSPHDVPPFANSAVDGYAVVAADTGQEPVSLQVLEDVPAGSVPRVPVTAGAATRIMTGAPMPSGADAVVMVEETEGDDTAVRVLGAVSPGDNVRPAGGDLQAGATVFHAGDRLQPVVIGILASMGVAEPLVTTRPTVAVFSTGDEVLPPETADLPPGAIRDSNRPMLVAMLEELGAEVHDLGIVPDDARLLRSTLDEAARDADAVVTSGGVSMGEHDLVKQVLADLGSVEFWRVAMQPGKPFAFGTIGGAPFFGLPGNPVSVIVAFEQFVRPALLRRMGATRIFRPRLPAVAAEPLHTDPRKTVFLRVVITDRKDGIRVAPAGSQSSNVLSALAAADAFAVVPVGTGTVEAGEAVEIESFRSVEERTMEEVLGG